jgi:hypothetical protein
MSEWKYVNLPLSKLFVDAGDAAIFICTDQHPKGERIEHTNGAGYQRDPFARQGWVKQRAAKFDDKVCRPLEVSKRVDGPFAGYYAILDGGGRWAMAQEVGLDKLSCRVHEGLTRKQEAKLFTMFDDIYKLRGIQLFVARVRAGSQVAVQIANAAKPYRIAERGQGTLKCVNILVNMYVAYGNDTDKGLKLIERTCKMSATGWSGFTEGGEPSGGAIDQRMIAALGLLIDTAGSKLDESVLVQVLKKNPPKQLQKRIENDYGEKLGNGATLYAAKHLASVYNRHFANAPSRKIDRSDIDGCSLWEAIIEGKTFAALVREAEEAAPALAQAA